MTFAPPPGTELVDSLGAGSSFDVALVREAGVVLVCKRLVPRSLHEPAGRGALVREAKLLAVAHHPALPTLVRVGTDGQGPFLLETYAAGLSLRAVCERWLERARPVPPRVVAHVAAAAVEGLAELSELADGAGPLELVHGDLGPDHLLLGPSGEVRVLDFGAARWRGMPVAPSLAERGSLPYVAPELARGEAQPSAATDLYALAATLLFFATAEPPCDARDEAAMLVEVGVRGVRLDALEHLTGLRVQERRALRAALAFDPANRLSRPRDLCDAFRLGDAVGSV